MAVNCGVSFGLCAVRLTKVAANGAVIAGDNSYVTDKAISIAVNPDIEEGNTFSARSGCGCSIARFKARNIFNWFNFTFTAAALEPEMISFLTGDNTILDGSDVVGVNGIGNVDCDDDEPAVALEFWTQHIVGSGQDGALPWVHWVFPKTIWSLGDNTFEEGIAQPVVTGYSRTNQLWGHGPYGEGPPDDSIIEEWGFWKTDVDPPSAECAAQPVTSTS